MSSISRSELAVQFSEALTNRLLAELTRIRAPQEIFELLYGLEWFALYQSGHHRQAMDIDWQLTLDSAVRALINTGGLR